MTIIEWQRAFAKQQVVYIVEDKEEGMALDIYATLDGAKLGVRKGQRIRPMNVHSDELAKARWQEKFR